MTKLIRDRGGDWVSSFLLWIRLGCGEQASRGRLLCVCVFCFSVTVSLYDTVKAQVYDRTVWKVTLPYGTPVAKGDW